LQADLERFLQPLEPLGDRREGDAEPAGFFLVPCGPYAEPGPAARQHIQRGVGLEHFPFRRADGPDLEEMIHHGDELETGVVRRASHRGQIRAQPGRAGRAGEVGDLQADLHATTSIAEALISPAAAARPDRADPAGFAVSDAWSRTP